MQEKLSQLDIGALFHGILFAYQKALAEELTANTTQAMLPHMLSCLERINAQGVFRFVEPGNPEKTLRGFGEVLVRSGLASNVDVQKTRNGFRFVVRECIFAEHIHKMLDPRDVTCPFGILAFSLAEKSSGTRVAKTLSTFGPRDSCTTIEHPRDSEVASHLRAWAGMTSEGVL